MLKNSQLSRQNLSGSTQIGRNTTERTRSVVLVGLLAATLSAGKLALSAIPNVEVVTLLILVYSAVLGWRQTVPATLCFCIVECMIYGFNTWVVTYFVHWNLLAVIGSLVLGGAPGKRSAVLAVVVAATMTTLFGVLSSAVDVTFSVLGGIPKSEFLRLFAAYYVRGAYFYLVHIVSNTVLALLLFSPLVRTIMQVQRGLPRRRRRSF